MNLKKNIDENQYILGALVKRRDKLGNPIFCYPRLKSSVMEGKVNG